MTRRKALGQHFLRSPRALHRIVETISPRSTDLIIEIGAGKGALTFPLTKRSGHVVAIEKDPKLISFLMRKNLPNITIIHGDVLRLDWEGLLQRFSPWKGEVKLVGNLPFSISSPLLFQVLEHRRLFPLVVFLLQREMAERTCALPRTKDYAPLSILFHLYYETNLQAVFPPHVFSPPPKVEAALITLRLRAQPLYEVQDEGKFKSFLRLCFRHRRKTLANNLKLAGIEEGKIKDALASCGLPPEMRPEEVEIPAFLALFNFLGGGNFRS